LAGEEPAKHVTWPAAGPNGVTLKAVDTSTLEAYVAAADGFEIRIQDGRIWVFRSGSEALQEFDRNGEPAKHVIRPAAGPRGMTIKAPDVETANAYLASVKP
jgi:sugar lactone lactonase YvrE